MKLLSLLAALALCFSSCYSFRGISIDPAVNTYYVATFINNALNAPPALEQRVTERLREKIRTESRLVQSDVDPDIEFQGSVVDYRVTSEAPRPGEFASLNRLTIVLAVEYINNRVEDAGFRKNFSFFYDFPATVALQTVQEEAIDEILDQVMEDIFNEAFTDW